MALTKPTLLQVPAFDATEEFTFTFVIPSATSQIVANQLIIRDQETNQIVYQEKEEIFKYEHIVNANELKNNTYYNATLIIYDNEGNQSPASTPIQFWCYTTPTIEITNMPPNNLIQNSSFNFEFTYNQIEGESINSYIVNLYNNAGVLVTSSGTQYTVNGTPPFYGNYQITGMDNASAFSIEVIGTTINNTIVSTGQISFTVQYQRPDLFTLVELTNNCEEGYISIRSNIILIEGESNPDPPIFINNQEVDLTNPEHWVKWTQGYKITGNYLARLWLRNPNPYSQILQFTNELGQTVTLYYMEGYENVEAPEMQSYFELHVSSIEGMEYYIFSNFIDILPDNEYYNVWLTQENGFYQLQIAKV